MPEIKMPKLSDTMTEGTLIAWKKRKGDKVMAGDVIAEIETDKATMEWESPEEGTLTEVYVEEGGKVNVGDRIAFIGSEGEKPSGKARSEIKKPTPAAEQKPEPAPPQKGAQTPKVAREGETKTGEEPRVKASPVARRVAAELGVDVSEVKGTGPDGRVTENDVRAASKSKGAEQPSVTASVTAATGARINLTGMRKVIAERLVASKA